ncbi:MAG: protease complex subunit PrcB family protein [Planctomycetes bacterium]|nr:protease complex subunit PrcB family protein [Planctomycetota bacterium]
MTRSFALFGLLLLGAGAASAQEVPFQTLAHGVMGPFGAPANHVIRSQQQLQASGVDRLLPPGTQIDWSREMVLAALMGTKSSGGYSIELRSVRREQMMTILPVPGPPPSFYLEARVEHRGPPPGSMVTMALTAPFHVVKLARTSERVDFVQVAPRAFTQVTFSITREPGSRGGHVTLASDGEATVIRSLPHARFAPVQGQATPDELDAVEQAVRLARARSLPAQLPVPHYIMAGDSFSLEVASDQPALAGSTAGDPGHLMNLEARLRPAITALEALVERIAPLPPPASEAEGVVRLRGGDVLLVEQPGKSYRITTREHAAVLRHFVGRTARVTGVIAPHAAVVPSPSNPLVIDVEVREIISPQRRLREAVQVQPAGGGVRVFVRGRPVRTFGPAAPALLRAGGRTADVDGWLLTDAQGWPSELMVDAVRARARAASLLSRNGYWVGAVRRGEEVTILAADASHALVRAGSRTGFIRLDRLTIGEVPVPLHAPAATPGLVGAVPGQ